VQKEERTRALNLILLGGERVKRVLPVLLVIILLVGLTAIGYTNEKVVLKYMTWVNALGAEWIEEDFIVPFQELYPNIEIQHEYVPFAEYWRKLMTSYAAGDPPDLMHMSVGYVYDYADRGLLLNLEPLFERDLNPDDFYAEPMKATRYPSMESGDLHNKRHRCAKKLYMELLPA